MQIQIRMHKQPIVLQQAASHSLSLYWLNILHSTAQNNTTVNHHWVYSAAPFEKKFRFVVASHSQNPKSYFLDNFIIAVTPAPPWFQFLLIFLTQQSLCSYAYMPRSLQRFHQDYSMRALLCTSWENPVQHPHTIVCSVHEKRRENGSTT